MTWIPAAAFAAVPKNLEEAARDAGASKFRVFRGITLRMAAPGILVAMVMSFISAFDEAQGTYLPGSNRSGLLNLASSPFSDFDWVGAQADYWWTVSRRFPNQVMTTKGLK
jgi:ABC-type spermidine/putrescine transport system permease subunit II